MTYTDVQIRVRYGETDRMGYVYYGNYAQYFEVARVEALRTFGISYREMEEGGIMLPVHTYSVKFGKPAYYDDLLTIRTRIVKLSGTRIFFSFETFNEKGEQINKAEISLVFINIVTQKPCQPPDSIAKQISN
ncbi:MAG: acyl-CoA thioesterase [Bacteroidia bacterium]